jgi:hypothetical protein
MTGDEASALEHARSIVELEDAFGVAVEASVQRALEGTAGLWLLNHAYLAAQVGVVPAAMIWLYRRDRLSYRRLRDTVLATWLLALPVFWLFPVAPPRLAELGIADTITQQTGRALDSKLTTASTTPSPPSRPCTAALRSRSRSRWQAAPGGAGRARWRSRGRRRSSSPSSPPATTSCSTSPPASPPPGSASAWRGSWPALAQPGAGARHGGPATRRPRSLPEVVALDDVRRLAAELGRFLDELPVELKASRASSAERHGRNAAQARAVRRERLERYVDAMTPAQRLRLAGALHLLSPRLDEDLAHPDERAA